MGKFNKIDKPSSHFNTKLVLEVHPRGSKTRILISRLKRKFLRHVWFVRGLIILSFAIILFVSALFVGSLIRKTSIGVYVSLGYDFLFTPGEKIKSFEGKTNFLILGKGGEGHEAPDLTDTIIFASVNHKDFSMTLISLPRDIWVPELRTKLNSVYYWGNRREVGGGIVLAKSSVEEIIGQPVHYGVVLDTSGFKRIIDALDGVSVDVEREFVDDRYPILGKENDFCDGDPEFKCRYETIHFQVGSQYMDGETALKFVRSRNAPGDEGTDLARSSRQQKVIQAIKEKVLTRDVLLSVRKLTLLKEAVLESTETDMPGSVAAIIGRRIFDGESKIRTFVLSDEFLENPPKSPKYDNLYVFLPKEGNWEKVHEWVLCVLGGDCN